MAHDSVSLRRANRTTLRRQVLLERAATSVDAVVERLVGLQAQQARPPYIGIWTRLQHFKRDDLHARIVDRHLVKATLMRATLHLCTLDDYLTFRPTLQPVLTSALDDILKQRGAHVDVDELVKTARQFMHVEPRTFADITEHFTQLFPHADPGAMRYSVRTHLPLVQVPAETQWSYPGNPKFALAEDWLSRKVPTRAARVDELIKRYLAAFGPATPRDFETWSYMKDTAAAFDALRPELVVYRDERGRPLFDLPELELEPEDAPAPIRFLPEFDNVLLAHQDRTRFVPTAARKAVYLPGLRVAATVLIDGFVGATWTTERAKKVATLRVSPLGAPLSRAVRNELEAEADRLLRFAEPGAAEYRVELD